MATYGIEWDWVVFKESNLDLTCTPPMEKVGCLALHRKYEGFPVKAPGSDIKIANPKDIMTQAMPHIQNLTENMVMAQIELALGLWMGLTDDVVQSFLMAVFLLSQAVTNMQNVVDVAEKYKEAKKEIINNILMGTLLVLPFLGELDMIADSLLSISRIITMIGDAGIGAMTVYSVVEDPKMALLTILETLLMYGMRNLGDFNRMGTARRDMTKDDIKSISASFKERNDQFQTIVAKCVKAP